MFGNNLKSFREKKNMTQKDLANLLGVSVSTISKYESNMLEPNIESLKTLADHLDITIDMLLRDKDEEYFDFDLLEVLREQKDMKLKGNLYHNTQISFAFNTNHIEGSTLTFEQTRYIYETNSIISDDTEMISVNDIFETINHFKLFDYMLDVADKPLTEDMIKMFHKILKANTLDSMKDWFKVGEYKTKANEVGGEKTTLPKNVAKEMKELIEKYNKIGEVTLEDIIEFHFRFEKIHPFQDGNGRIGRMIMFKECLKNGIIPFIILDRDKPFYYRGLKKYGEKEKGFLIDTILNAQDQYKIVIRNLMGRDMSR